MPKKVPEFIGVSPLNQISFGLPVIDFRILKLSNSILGCRLSKTGRYERDTSMRGYCTRISKAGNVQIIRYLRLTYNCEINKD